MKDFEKDILDFMHEITDVFGKTEFCVTREYDQLRTPRFDKVNKTKGQWVSLRDVNVKEKQEDIDARPKK